MTRAEAIELMLASEREWDRETGKLMQADPNLGHLDARRLAANAIMNGRGGKR